MSVFCKSGLSGYQLRQSILSFSQKFKGELSEDKLKIAVTKPQQAGINSV